ncbi:MAG: hypothetical protein ABSH36_13365 [Solirubrobacteraceae bacterium]
MAEDVAQGSTGPHTIVASRWRTSRIADLLTWSPLALGGAYLLVVAIQFNQLIANTYLDADAASAPVIGQLYGGSPAHREVVLGQMTWFSTLMFELATRWLPLHRQIWEAAPYAMALASVALVAWGLWRIAGRWAATIGAVIMVCAAPHTLHLLFSLNDHSPTWFSFALLAGLLVLLERRAADLAVLPTVLAVVLVGAIVGANMASDTLLIGAGVLPALLAVSVAWALRPGRASRRAWWLMLDTIVVAGVCDALTGALMSHENVGAPPGITHTGLAAGEAVASNFKLWWQSIAVLGNGDFFGQSLGFTSALQVVCAALSILAVAVLVPRISWRELARDVQRRLGGPADGGSRQLNPGRADAEGAAPAVEGGAARVAWCAFWGSSAVLLSVGFIVSSTPVDINSDRYLVGLLFAAAALIPLLAGRSVLRQVAITACTMVFAFTGLVQLLQGQATANISNFPTDTVSAEVARIARREHATIGYAGYWDAAPITWSTHFGVKVYPVQACGPALCPVSLHYITSWYIPRRGQRSFLISDPTQPGSTLSVPSLGSPTAVYHVGALTMSVYSYDIASHMVPTP